MCGDGTTTDTDIDWPGWMSCIQICSSCRASDWKVAMQLLLICLPFQSLAERERPMQELFFSNPGRVTTCLLVPKVIAMANATHRRTVIPSMPFVLPVALPKSGPESRPASSQLQRRRPHRAHTVSLLTPDQKVLLGSANVRQAAKSNPPHSQQNP